MNSTLKLINDRLELYQGAGFREHLGASIIGKECPRQVWYIFRWARKANFQARLLRLFDRGHREEDVIIDMMRKAGIHVENMDPATGKQFRVSDHEDHFGGSLDAEIYDPPEFPGEKVLGEFKTHNENSFKKLRRQGLEKSKPQYYVQAHIYMHYRDLPACLHFNVNKNDDDIEIIELEFDPTTAQKYIDRAYKIINSPVPPPRPENASPAWYICKFCDYKRICHFHMPMEKNCRTCVNAQPVDSGRWHCNHFGVFLSKHDQMKGCQEHKMIPSD